MAFTLDSVVLSDSHLLNDCINWNTYSSFGSSTEMLYWRSLLELFSKLTAGERQTGLYLISKTLCLSIQASAERTTITTWNKFAKLYGKPRVLPLSQTSTSPPALSAEDTGLKGASVPALLECQCQCRQTLTAVAIFQKHDIVFPSPSLSRFLIHSGKVNFLEIQWNRNTKKFCKISSEWESNCEITGVRKQNPRPSGNKAACHQSSSSLLCCKWWNQQMHCMCQRDNHCMGLGRKKHSPFSSPAY